MTGIENLLFHDSQTLCETSWYYNMHTYIQSDRIVVVLLLLPLWFIFRIIIVTLLYTIHDAVYCIQQHKYIAKRDCKIMMRLTNRYN